MTTEVLCDICCYSNPVLRTEKYSNKLDIYQRLQYVLLYYEQNVITVFFNKCHVHMSVLKGNF